MTDLPAIILGAGGHAKVVIDALKASGGTILGLTDIDQKTHGKSILGVPVMGADDKVLEHKPDDVALINGVGSIRVSGHRKEIFERFLKAGFAFPIVIHPSAIIGEDVEISEGSQVMAGAVIQPACRIGANCIINTRASIDHDCVIGAHSHIAPGAVLGGSVTVGEGVHIGAGATVIQNIEIGAGALVAAGAVVTRNVADGVRVAGVPAREM